MTLDDRYVTPTPEGVSLSVELAGLGSRFGAFALDVVLQVVVYIGIILVVTLSTINDPDAGPIVAGVALGGFLLIFVGYFIVCELLFSGRSVGKLAAGIRVVTLEGTAIGFGASLLRNIARLVDWLPSGYFCGVVCILASSKNQRLGDMLAGTIVVRVRHTVDRLDAGAAHDVSAWTSPVLALAPLSRVHEDALRLVDVSAVSDEEVSLVHQFLARRSGYTPDARARLAGSLATRLAGRVRGVSAEDPEVFLETVARARSLRR